MSRSCYVLTDTQRRELVGICGERVNFQERERKLYDHDVGLLPGLARPLAGRTVPAAVVQPENEEEVVKLVRWAARHDVPLVPRGSATAGYGGAVPARGGVVVETVRLRRVIKVDRERLTATVEPGVVWQDLADALAPRGLAPRLVPSSAPGSTVGGWFAQAGAGFGSYQYGWFAENVVAARAVLPSGEVRDFAGADLQKLSGAMGTTGLITRLTINLRPLREEGVLVATLPTAGQVQKLLQEIEKRQLPLWHAGFLNPTGARLKNQVPPKTHHGHPHPRPVLPEAFIVTLAFDGRDEKTRGALRELVQNAGGKLLPEETAAHEWAERFHPMKVKRLGPSLVPSEAVVPLAKVAEVFAAADRKIRLPLVIEATVVKGGEVVLLGFIPHDERRFGFNLAYSLALSLLKIAQAHGGRAYGAGLYLANEAPAVHGKNWAPLNQYKRQVDPQDILNPLKLTGKGGLKSFISLARAFEPVARFLGNMAKPSLGERWERSHGLPGDVNWYAYACAQCGYCRNVCTLYDGRGWESSSPRGKWYYLKLVSQGKERFDQEMVDTFLMCTTCEKCDFVCQLDLPVEPAWATMRGELVHKSPGKHITFPAFEIMAASLDKEKNIWANFSKDRAAWVPEELKGKIKEKAEVAYFAGCTASFVEQDIGQASMKLLDAAGVEFTYLGEEEACCGIPMLVAGRWDVFERILRHNIAAMQKRGVKTVVTSCPACWLSWHTYYPEWAAKLGLDFNFEAKHYSEVLAEKIAAGDFKFTQPVNMKVTFHDSCHIGRAGGVYEPPRELLKAVPGIELVEMEHNRENALCCGSVLTRISEPDPTSNRLGKRKIDEAIATGAEAIVALCPCCQFQMRVAADANKQEMPVKDLAAIAARGLGIDLPDPTPYALEMWAIFDKMIDLMRVPQMADLMVELLPVMMDAMPGPLKAMMRAMKYIPGGLALMKPMMPKMMPMLMPMVMPKVLPEMLRAVGRRVPMPDFMAAQMPDLMPKVMDNLMPVMLPDIAKRITPVMINYIKTGSTGSGRAAAM